MRLFNFRKKATKQAAVAPDKRQLTRMLGFTPKNIGIYCLAFIDPALHEPNDPERIRTNDRLEFLGDGILGMVVADWLYHKHPDWNVGKLASEKSAIVSRSVSNRIAGQLGIGEMLLCKPNSPLNKDSAGNALEAIIGAIFIDRGMTYAKQFILEKMLPLYYRIANENSSIVINYKGDLQIWADRRNITLHYKTEKGRKGFIGTLSIGSKIIASGIGRTKKDAEQDAARLACAELKVPSAYHVAHPSASAH